MSNSEKATRRAASHAICVLAIRSNVMSWATGALFPCNRLCGVPDPGTGLGATDGLGA